MAETKMWLIQNTGLNVILIYFVLECISSGQTCIVRRHCKDVKLTPEQQSVQIAGQLGKFFAPMDILGSNILLLANGGNGEQIQSSFYTGLEQPITVPRPIKPIDHLTIPDSGVVIRSKIDDTGDAVLVVTAKVQKKTGSFTIEASKDDNLTSVTLVKSINGCNFDKPYPPMSGVIALGQILEEKNSTLVSKIEELPMFTQYNCFSPTPFLPSYIIISTESFKLCSLLYGAEGLIVCLDLD